MGDVKESVKGSGPPSKRKKKVKYQGNLQEGLSSLMDEVSACIQTKDHETETEGPGAKAENERKAGLLRGVYSLLSSAKTMLLEY